MGKKHKPSSLKSEIREVPAPVTAQLEWVDGWMGGGDVPDGAPKPRAPSQWHAFSTPGGIHGVMGSDGREDPAWPLPAVVSHWSPNFSQLQFPHL